MSIYLAILKIFYIILAVIAAGFVGWNVFLSKKMTNKIIGAVTLIMLVLRIFMIK